MKQLLFFILIFSAFNLKDDLSKETIKEQQSCDYTLIIDADDFANQETSVEIIDEFGDIVLSVPIGNIVSSAINTFPFSTPIPSPHLTITIQDSWGDGMQAASCGFGNIDGTFAVVDTSGSYLFGPQYFEGCDCANCGVVNETHTFPASCSPIIPGCTNPCAINYDPGATEDDGSCDFGIIDDGCDITEDLYDEVACVTIHIPDCPEGTAFDAAACSCEDSFTCPEDIIISSSEIFCGASMNVVNNPTHTVISINGEDLQLINNNINIIIENDDTQLIKDEAEIMLNDFINTIKLCIQKAKQLTDEAKQLIECAKKLEQEANELDKAAKKAEQDAKEDFEDSVAIMTAGILAAGAAALAGGIPGWIAAAVAITTAATLSAQAAERGAEHMREAKDLRNQTQKKRDVAKEKMEKAKGLHILVKKEIKKIEKMLKELEMLFQPLIANNEFDIQSIINNLNLSNQHLNQRKQLFNNIDSIGIAINILTDSIENNNNEISLLSYKVERSFMVNEELLTWVDEAAIANNDEEFARLLNLVIDRYSVTEDMINDIILYTNQDIPKYDSIVLMSNNIDLIYEADSTLNNQMDEIFDQTISGIDSLTINIDEIISVDYVLPIGTTTIGVESIDSLGNLNSCTFDVTVFDDKVPEWMKPDSLEIFVANDSSFCGAIVDYGFPIIYEACPATIELVEGLGSGSLYPVGTTVDIYQATDASGNTSTYDVSIIVQDKELPKFDNCPDTLTYFTTPNSCSGDVILPPFSAIDNCNPDITVGCGWPPGQVWNGGSSPFQSDEYWFTAITEDYSGNQNTWRSLVQVIDNQNPSMICKDITVALNGNDTTYISAIDIDNGSFDNCQIVGLSVVPSMFTSNDIGTNTLTMRAIDSYGNISSCQGIVNITSNSTLFSAKIFLSGSRDSDTILMRDDLRTLSDFPLTSPYGTGESIAPLVLATTEADAIVDWIKIELRDPTDPTMVVATRSALIQRDGDIVDLDGVSPVALAYSGDYYVVIDHRNHLGIMSAEPLSLSGSVSYDFTTAQHQAYGTNAMMDMDGVYGMIGGDANGSNSISAADRAETWNYRNISGYYDHDVNLSGGTTAADRAMAWNNRNLQSQIPT